MKLLALLIPLVLIGCSQATPEEKEAAKYPPPNMMSEEEGRKFMEGQKDPRTGGPARPTGP